MESVPDLSAIPCLSLVAMKALEMPHGVLDNFCTSVLYFEALPNVLYLSIEASQI